MRKTVVSTTKDLKSSLSIMKGNKLFKNISPCNLTAFEKNNTKLPCTCVSCSKEIKSWQNMQYCYTATQGAIVLCPDCYKEL
jgi:hypothetical protein